MFLGVFTAHPTHRKPWRSKVTYVCTVATDRREDLVGDERQCHSLLVKGGAALQPS